MASFTVSPSAIPQSHAGAITLTLAGTSTSWTSGSTVTVQNSVTGTTTVTKGTWTDTSATAATLTVTTGAGAGTYTITVDGVVSPSLTVGAGSFVLSATTAITNAMRRLVATGTNTVWTQEDPTPLFTLAGGSGSEIASIVVTANTSATLTIGTGTATGTLTVTDAVTSATATITLSAMVAGNSYYASPAAGSGGAGTLGNPFLLGDLINTSGLPSSPAAAGPAFTGLNPGDTLYFRGGTYNLSVANTSSAGAYQLMGPTHSGTASQPITITNFPGESVCIILGGTTGQPCFGTSVPQVDYVRFVGLSIVSLALNDYGPTYGTNNAAAFLIAGTGCEVGHCKVVGTGVSTLDNHDGIIASGQNGSCTGAWFHHNEITGWTSWPVNQANTAGFKVYKSVGLVFEDNYVHGNTTGVFDKDSGASLNGNAYRRNWLTGNAGAQFRGNNQTSGAYALYVICDNVIDGGIDLYQYDSGTRIYNNLIRTGEVDGSGATGLLQAAFGNAGGAVEGGLNPFCGQLQIFNNIVLPSGDAAVNGYIDPYNNIVTGAGTANTFAFFNKNVYSGTPSYYLNHAYTLAAFQALGYEAATTGAVARTSIYPNYNSGDLNTLAATYQTYGRYGDAVGPRVAVSGAGGILDATRYGRPVPSYCAMAAGSNFLAVAM